MGIIWGYVGFRVLSVVEKNAGDRVSCGASIGVMWGYVGHIGVIYRLSRGI